MSRHRSCHRHVAIVSLEMVPLGSVSMSGVTGRYRE